MPRLLLVDDDDKFRDVMQKLLSGCGFEVTGYSDGNAAIQALTERPPDLMVCDIYMKPLSGLDVLKAAIAAHPNLPIIMLTAFGSMETAIECLRAGAFDYLTKPFRVPE